MRRAVGGALAVAALAVSALLLWPPGPPGETGTWIEAAGLQARFEVVEGVRVRYVEDGSGSALVLLHGFASSIYTWKDVMPALAGERRVVALDFPGFGQSDQPPDLSFELLPRVVLSLLDRLGIGRAAVAGNSMGGAVAVVIAARSPARVERLVLIDATGYDTEAGQRPFLLRLLASRPTAALLARLPVRDRLIEIGLRQVFQDDSRVTRERVDEYAAPLRRPGTMPALRSLLTGSTAPRLVADLAPRVEAPTLILWGRQDRWIPVEHARRFAAAIAGSRSVVLEDCGHLPQEERPEEVVRLLREFLGDPGPRAAPEPRLSLAQRERPRTEPVSARGGDEGLSGCGARARRGSPVPSGPGGSGRTPR